MNSLPQTIGTFASWVFNHADTVELPYPVIQVKDTFTDNGVTFSVEYIGACPFYVMPSEWKAYSMNEEWCYCWAQELRTSKWVPLSRLYQLMEG